jgi:hypothetical protein
MPNEPSLGSLLEIFSFEKKSDLVRHCKDLTISSDDFFKLVLACEMWGVPFLHAITHKDKVPPHLVPKDSEIEALQNTPAGSLLTGGAAKAISKLAQAFEDRRYLVGHIFFTPDKSKWHFFCFDQRDLNTKGNHWEQGSHVHFINWLWPNFTADTVWQNFTTDDDRPGSDLHLRFVEPERENKMEIKKCEFTQPVEKRSSSGLHRGMFDEDVRFELNVTIDSSEREHLEEMLRLFEKMSSSFKEVWGAKLASMK